MLGTSPELRGCREILDRVVPYAKFTAVSGGIGALVLGPTQEIQAVGAVIFSAVVLKPAAEGAIAAVKDIFHGPRNKLN